MLIDCPFCKQEYDWDMELTHLADCPNYGLHGKKFKAQGIIYVANLLFKANYHLIPYPDEK